MPPISFGKRQCFPNIATNALAERVGAALLMSCFTSFFPNTPMRFCGEYGLIGLPEITITATLAKFRRNTVSQSLTRPFAVIAQDKRQNVLRPV